MSDQGNDHQEFAKCCGNCKYGAMMLQNATQYECRRFPPTAHLLGVTPNRQPMFANAFPIVPAKGLSCGEFALKLVKN